MDNNQLAIAYATSKVLGYEKSIDDFENELLEIYSKTIKELNSRPTKSGKAEATENPFRRTMY